MPIRGRRKEGTARMGEMLGRTGRLNPDGEITMTMSGNPMYLIFMRESVRLLTGLGCYVYGFLRFKKN